MYYNVLQCITTYYNVLQRIAMCCNVLQRITMPYNALPFSSMYSGVFTMYYNALMFWNVLQCMTMYDIVLHCIT